jgi:hypothetical protein
MSQPMNWAGRRTMRADNDNDKNHQSDSLAAAARKVTALAAGRPAPEGIISFHQAAARVGFVCLRARFWPPVTQWHRRTT